MGKLVSTVRTGKLTPRERQEAKKREAEEHIAAQVASGKLRIRQMTESERAERRVHFAPAHRRRFYTYDR